MRRNFVVGPLMAVAITLGCGNSPTSPNQKSLIASVSILLDTVTTVPGAQLYGLGTKVLDTLGQPEPPTFRLTWTSSDPTKATVDSFGLVQILATGPVNIIAATDGHADTLRIHVVNFDFASVNILGDHACGTTSQHVAVCWGANNGVDELGIPDPALVVSGPVAVQGAPALVSVTVGANHSCGVTAAGVAYCWGGNDEGQLGIGHVDSRPHLPTRVLGGLTFASILGGYSNTCGLTTAEAAYCWGADEGGRNGHGGDGSAAIDSLPIPVSGGLTFRTLAVGVLNGCGITTDSLAYCWGEASQDEIGAFPLPGSCGVYLSTSFCAAPVPVGGRQFVAIASGFQDACGLAVGGAAYCWGTNSSGSTGDTLYTDSLPFAVGGGNSFASISTTYTHTCGLTTTGAAYCWGTGTNGELGNGGTASNHCPSRCRAA